MLVVVEDRRDDVDNGIDIDVDELTLGLTRLDVVVENADHGVDDGIDVDIDVGACSTTYRPLVARRADLKARVALRHTSCYWPTSYSFLHRRN